MVKYLIIGAGPAGIQMGHFLKGQDYVILEKSASVCDFFRYFPRQRKFISINKSRNLRFDWNSFLGDDKSFRDYSEDLYPSADDYLLYVEDFVNRHSINIRFNYEVTSIQKVGNKFIINNEYEAEYVFYGTGLVPKEPDIEVHPSIKVYTYANMPLDKEVYRDKNVWIMGNGNAALETADFIAPFSGFTVICGRNVNAWNTHYPGHARSKNFASIDSYYLKAGTGYMFDQDENSSYTESSTYKIVKNQLKTPINTLKPIDIVIFCTGFRFNGDIVKHLVDIDKFPILTPNFESTKCPNLFFIGSASQRHDFKKGTSAFIHGFRYNCEYISRYLHGFNSIISTKQGVVGLILKQINESSSLFHRFDYFCDLIGRLSDGRYEYIKEIPVSTVSQFLRSNWISYFTVRLGYMNSFDDHFVQKVYAHPRDAHKCRFIHPIFETRYEIFHLPENLFNDFLSRDWHLYPLVRFIEYFEQNITWEQLLEDLEKIPDNDGGEIIKFKEHCEAADSAQ
jgi:thioredoxin reductase